MRRWTLLSTVSVPLNRGFALRILQCLSYESYCLSTRNPSISHYEFCCLPTASSIVSRIVNPTAVNVAVSAS